MLHTYTISLVKVVRYNGEYQYDEVSDYTGISGFPMLSDKIDRLCKREGIKILCKSKNRLHDFTSLIPNDKYHKIWIVDYPDTSSTHHPGCKCFECAYGSDAYKFNFNPSEY